ncbi:hypothetical protein A9Q84_02000 [Halobacteriovorax marinus]|uniref:ABC transporter domain-containing protein n=1 Tax=Halobacteriovorax marinus TaxID=97084 RepID=A0A1Y5FCG2_9BACT|nr:hypothetical protein A9Q84_02000 [Halobacteriovorax marinus]
MALLVVKDVFKSFDIKSIAAVDHLSFSIQNNEIVSVIGPSGTGKSTIVKIISGLLDFQSGSVLFAGKELVTHQSKNESLLRKISYVPQELSLDESKTVLENIGINLVEENEEKRHHLIRDMVETFGLQYKDHKFPSELSTGQKGRVEMAKALVTNPKLLILDEPFANLDRSLRNELKEELLEILKERKISAIVVTHDLEDAYSHSDRILVLSDGKIKQFSGASDIYLRPHDAWVAKFSGTANLMAGKVLEVNGDDYLQENKLGKFSLRCFDSKVKKESFAYMLIRPEACIISENGSFKGKLKKLVHMGSFYEGQVQMGGIEKFKILINHGQKFKVGQSLRFDIDSSQCQLLSI